MKKTLFCIAAIAALLSSCNKDEQSAQPALSEDMNSSVITMLPATAGLETKAAIDGTTFPTDRTFHLSAYYNAAAGTSGNYFTDITYAKITEQSYWGATPAKYYPFDGTLDLFAVSYDGLTINSPTYDTKASDGVTLVVPDNSTIQTDILHGSVQTQAKTGTSVAMSFGHAEALLCFVAKSDVVYDGTGNLGITIEEIAVEDAYFGGTVAIKATDADKNYCTWSALTAQQTSVKLLNSATSTTALGYNVPGAYMDHTVDGNHMGIGGVGIVVPEQAQTKVTIKYTQHNGKDAKSANIDNIGLLYSFNLSNDWTEGHKYVYQIYFKPKEITITPTVVNWVATEVKQEI